MLRPQCCPVWPAQRLGWREDSLPSSLGWLVASVRHLSVGASMWQLVFPRVYDQEERQRVRVRGSEQDRAGDSAPQTETAFSYNLMSEVPHHASAIFSRSHRPTHVHRGKRRHGYEYQKLGIMGGPTSHLSWNLPH